MMDLSVGGPVGGPLLEQVLVGLDEALFHELALLDGELAALFAVVHDARQ